MGNGDEESLQAMVRNFIPWVRERLKDGRYLGWLVLDRECVVAGAGMWLMEFPPHWRDPKPLRAYLDELLCSARVAGARAGSQLAQDSNCGGATP